MVISGATSGIGRDVALKFAQMGAHVQVLGRNPAKLDALESTPVKPIPAANAPGSLRGQYADFAEQESIRLAAESIQSNCPSIDILVNCVGGNFPEREPTTDGFEQTWAVNHLGPYLLTRLLLPQVKAANSGRIIQVSSATARGGRIHDDVSLPDNWSSMRAYAQAKLAINLTVATLAERLSASSATINALHPGWINTGLGRGAGMRLSGTTRAILQGGASAFAKPAYAGGNSIVALACANYYQDVSGEFIFEDHIKPRSKAVHDTSMRERVWNLSSKQVQLPT